MIVVIADDLTGAGEMGGIGLAYGFKVELQRCFCPDCDAQLLIIDTDTRSLSPPQAGRVLRDIGRQLNESHLPIDWIYKKTDSVLRGPVAHELEALRDVMHAARVLLIPANPSKGRIVRDGHYIINGKPLGETDFSNDPEYPATTSCVRDLPGVSGAGQLHVLKSDQPFPGKGITIGQAETTDDLLYWADRMDRQTLMAGAGEFFQAILQNKGFLKKKDAIESPSSLAGQALFVCGSSSDFSRRALRDAESLGASVCRMPEALFTSAQAGDGFVQQWTDEIIERFENSRHVIMAIDRQAVKNAEFAGQLSGIMATTVGAVFGTIPLTELFVEGGATASRIVECLKWNRFQPCNQLGPGVVRMKVLQSDGVCLTVKPGSYPWPDKIRNVFLKGSSYAD